VGASQCAAASSGKVSGAWASSTAACQPKSLPQRRLAWLVKYAGK
jgi:hypothetical protein